MKIKAVYPKDFKEILLNLKTEHKVINQLLENGLEINSLEDYMKIVELIVPHFDNYGYEVVLLKNGNFYINWR